MCLFSLKLRKHSLYSLKKKINFHFGSCFYLLLHEIEARHVYKIPYSSETDSIPHGLQRLIKNIYKSDLEPEAKHMSTNAQGLLHQQHGADSGGFVGESYIRLRPGPPPPPQLCPLCQGQCRCADWPGVG